MVCETMQPEKIAVISGKGGVGKSTIATSLSLELAKDYNVGLLDVDIHGPNLSDILGGDSIEVEDGMLVPAEVKGLEYISMGQIASEGHAIIWEDEDRRSAVKQLKNRTEWGDLDYLVLDFPPGLGSEVQEMLPEANSALIVTVPSTLSTSKVERCLDTCRETETPVLGLIRNFSEFQCPNCGSSYDIFPEDGGFEEIPTLAEIPIKRKIAQEKIINDFPAERVLQAMDNPVVLEKKGKPMKRALLKFIGGVEK